MTEKGTIVETPVELFLISMAMTVSDHLYLDIFSPFAAGGKLANTK